MRVYLPLMPSDVGYDTPSLFMHHQKDAWHLYDTPNASMLGHRIMDQTSMTRDLGVNSNLVLVMVSIPGHDVC